MQPPNENAPLAEGGALKKVDPLANGIRKEDKPSGRPCPARRVAIYVSPDIGADELARTLKRELGTAQLANLARAISRLLAPPKVAVLENPRQRAEQEFAAHWRAR
jgi:hypothetical protein